MSKPLIFSQVSQAHTPADRVREALLEAERMMPGLRGAGPQVLKLPHLFDQVAETLTALEAVGVDVRAEQARFKAVLERLHRSQGRFLAEAGAAFQKERVAARPDRARWWWFLDEVSARERRQRLRRVLAWSLVAVLVLAIAWLAYDRFLAPPPGVQRASRGEALVSRRDLQAALVEFEAAAALAPDKPKYQLWLGVIHVELGKPGDAERAFENARALYETDFDFWLNRSLLFLRVGDLEAAGADVEQAVLADPESGEGYFLRANIAEERGDCAAAVADLERAAGLARAAGDTWLEGEASVHRAMVMQSCQPSTLAP